MPADFIEQAKTAYPTEVAHFDDLIDQDRLSHLYLLVGPGQPEKLAFSRYLAWRVLGPDQRNEVRVAEDDHPDLQVVASEKPGGTIKIGQIRLLTTAFTTTALEADRKVFIIDQAQNLTTAAANALLKFIEEPAGPQLILLLAPNLTEILPTIRSRAQVVHLQPVNLDEDRRLEGEWDSEEEAGAKRALVQWFKLALLDDPRAFAQVATQLVPTFTTPGQQRLALNWIQQLIRDVLVFQQLPNDRLYFPDLADFYQQARDRFNLSKLLAASQVILATDQLRHVNISFQARLEKLTLELGAQMVQ
ncbi:DNA polymerase III subunit delta [Leuconostocaceae bacterium ESL0723]|nr:DNA polymerase III subunit delta [Leuconostocaceae bacterium ESL0723]